jgi:8-amino-7-oxononanoate synthase
MIEANRSTVITLDGKQFLYFGGTNYLGIAHRRALLDAATKAFEQFGFSSGASRLTSGETDLLVELERELASFCKADGALILPAGYMGNSAVVDAINDKIDHWIIAKNAHGSIKAAVAHTGKVLTVDELGANALDNRSLRGRLGLRPEAKLGIFAEPVDPLLGDVYDVSALVKTVGADDYVVLDECHSIGVLGEFGRGAIEHFALKRMPNLIRTGTFSKAFGAQGGFIVGAAEVIDNIKRNSYTYKVSTPLSPVCCAASRAALALLREDPASTITALRQNMTYMNARLRALGYKQFAKHATPIYHLPDSPAMRALRTALSTKGIFVPMVTSYFADYCEIGLRWTIQAGHTTQHIDKLMDAIAAASPQPQR